MGMGLSSRRSLLFREIRVTSPLGTSTETEIVISLSSARAKFASFSGMATAVSNRQSRIPLKEQEELLQRRIWMAITGPIC
jgi:hypothetical protein